ncbi:glutamine--fructose-6-phosphate transaminase (isomerizing) [Candidatus Gracilibacteria bacterium]|nr:glutamine--fructose-6-phosphate transaminase (isomerizing) [Candidatus Gracilibacteria bacterium]MCF7819059.1 glutamine--fructose-6-phosphate transaminase (isomerizing) [Candidatus Gracilibacteria bacterium]
MCGIFAVSGDSSKAGSSVLKGLKKLEYRGYDSWGVCVREQESGTIFIEKEVGKISTVKRDFPAGREAIGHSRWATHGGVTRTNAHPHKVGRVTLVHNGIFENYLDEKKKLSAYAFASETDTEVIAALIDSFLAQDIEPLQALQRAACCIKGRFAILVMIEGREGIFAARRGSPLIIGRGATQTFIASDVPAFLEQTNVVNYLDDDEMVHVVGNKAHFFHLETGTPIEKRNISVPWKVEDAEKGDWPHFMIKEIFDQKKTIQKAIDHEDRKLQQAAKLLENSNGAYFVACGTAHKVAMAAEYFFADIVGRKINVVPASEMPSFERFVNPKTVIIAVSQSGETADVLEILERGKKKGAKILALTNVVSSSMARLADVHLPINAGPEKAVASTKAATAQMALLFLLAYTEIGQANVGRQILRSTASSINDMLNPRYENYIRSVAERISQQPNLFIIGRKSLYPMALESAIKIQEVSYINAQGFAAGELKHGPIALIEKNTPCLVLGDDPETLSNAIELKSRGASLIGVSPTRHDVFQEWLRVPDCNGAQAIASIIPVQILAYHLALLRGLDPDMPRNLAKSVTVK